MANIFSERQRLLAISESTYGTDAVEAAFADGTQDLIYQQHQGSAVDGIRTIIETAQARSSASGSKHISVPEAADVASTLLLTGREGSGAGEEAPLYDVFMSAAGFEKTIVASTSATYNLATAQQSAASVYLYHDQDNGQQRLRQAVGVRGNIDFVFNNNEAAIAEFTGRGRYVNFLSDEAQFFDASTGAAALRADGTTPVAARTTGSEIYGNLDPVIVRNITVTVDGVELCLSAFNISTNWALIERTCADGVSALNEVLLNRPLTGSRPGGSFTFDDSVTANIDALIQQFEDAEEITFSAVLTAGDGSAGSARITFAAPKLQIGQLGLGDNSGIVQFDVPFSLNGDFSSLSADNELTVTYDAVP